MLTVIYISLTKEYTPILLEKSRTLFFKELWNLKFDVLTHLATGAYYRSYLYGAIWFVRFGSSVNIKLFFLAWQTLLKGVGHGRKKILINSFHAPTSTPEFVQVLASIRTWRRMMQLRLLLTSPLKANKELMWTFPRTLTPIVTGCEVRLYHLGYRL